MNLNDSDLRHIAGSALTRLLVYHYIREAPVDVITNKHVSGHLDWNLPLIIELLIGTVNVN